MVDRLERIILDLDDRFSPKIARSSLAARAFANELDRAGSSSEDLDDNLGGLATTSDRVSASTRKTDQSINQLTGRLRLLRDTAALLGPALIPIGAVGAVGLSGVAMTAGLATAGLLALVAASQGVGDAISAVENARLEPTVANLQAADEAMAQLAPNAREFVTEFQQLRPVLSDIADAGADSFFPGLTASLEEVDQAAPALERLFSAIGETSGEGIGGLISGAAGDTEFLDFLTAEAPQAIGSLIDLTGTLSHGLSRMFMSLAPGNNALLDWANGVADAFDRWASSPQGREDVRAFLEYAEQTGPAVADFFSSLASAITQVVQAAAPLGGPTLEVLSTVLDVVGNVADSDLGTPIMVGVGALAAYNRTLAVTTALQARAGTGGVVGGLGTYATNLRSSVPTLRQWGTAALYAAHSNESLTKAAGSSSVAVAAGARNAMTARSAVSGWAREASRAAGPIAGLAVLSTGAADSMGLTNTASLALAGTMAGPWGAAVGAGVGLLLDVRAAGEQTANTITSLNDAIAAGDLTGAGAKYDDLMSRLRDSQNQDGLGDLFGDLFTNRGSLYEGIDATEQQLMSLTDILSGVAEEGGTSISENWTNNFDDLQRVLSSAQPAMARLGITAEELANADVGEQAGYIADISHEMARMDSNAGRVDAVADAFAGLDNDMLSTADSAAQVAAAIDSLISPVLDAKDAAIQWRGSLRDLEGDLAAGSKALFGNTQASDQNKAAINERGRALLALLSAQANNGASAEELTRTLRSGRRALIQTGIDAGIGAKEMRRYAESMRLTPRLVRTLIRQSGMSGAKKDTRDLRKAYRDIPDVVRTIITSGGMPKTREEAVRLARQLDLTGKERRALITIAASQAERKGKDVAMMLGDIDGTNATATANVDGSNAFATISGINRSVQNMPDGFINIYVNRVERRADGGTVWNGTAGGTVPGQRLPYGDRVPTLLTAGGEEVISNRYGQADRHRSLLKAINDNRLADASSYARAVRYAVPAGGVSSTVRHVFEHHVKVTGELDADRAVATIKQRIDSRAQDVYDANREFEDGHGLR